MIGIGDTDFGEVRNGGLEFVQGEDDFDEIGFERAFEIALSDLFEDMKPGIARGEEEADLGEIRVGIFEGLIIE